MSPAELRNKADQHYEMAGLAYQDGDIKDGERHMALAKSYDAQAKALLSN